MKASSPSPHGFHHPDGPLCLTCEQTRTWSEGQLCEACVDKGHRVENDTVIVNLTPFLHDSSGRWEMHRPVPGYE